MKTQKEQDKGMIREAQVYELGKIEGKAQAISEFKEKLDNINLMPIISYIEKRDLSKFPDDIHKRVYCLVDMRLFANSIIEELKLELDKTAQEITK